MQGIQVVQLTVCCDGVLEVRLLLLPKLEVAGATRCRIHFLLLE